MRKAVVWGAGGTGHHVYDMNCESYDVLCFVDNDTSKYVGGGGGKLPIRSPEVLRTLDFDVILLGTLMGLEEVPLQMKELGIPAWKLDKTYVEISVKSRILFLQRFAEVARKKSIIGSVAEGGVYRGEFAKYINRYFPDRNCYLFDTFEGFTDYDIEKEHGSSMLAGTDTAANHLKNVNIEEVLAKMPNRDKIILRVGRFPETAQGIDDVFAFVNLDMNLYEPTIEGLRFFYPRMSEGGVILIHDYFNSICPNIETAIDDFEHELGRSVRRMPIGDDLSMAIVK